MNAIHFGLRCLLARRFAENPSLEEQQQLQRALRQVEQTAKANPEAPWVAKISGWMAELARAYRSLAGESCTLPSLPKSCSACPNPQSDGHTPIARDHTQLCETILPGLACRICRQIKIQIEKCYPNITEAPGEIIKVQIVEENQPTPSGDFGLPFRAMMTYHPTRPVVSFAFIPCLSPPSDEELAGIYYAFFHEICHALDHMMDRHTPPFQSHTPFFSEGWLDQVAAILCRREIQREEPGHPGLEQALGDIRQRRLEGIDVAEKDRTFTSSWRTGGVEIARTIRCLFEGDYSLPDGSLLSAAPREANHPFWKLTAALFAGPVQYPPYGRTWRSQVIQALAPLWELALYEWAEEPPPLHITRIAEPLLRILARLNEITSLDDALALCGQLIDELNKRKEDQYDL